MTSDAEANSFLAEVRSKAPDLPPVLIRMDAVAELTDLLPQKYSPDDIATTVGMGTLRFFT
jgi:hypothetical protein